MKTVRWILLILGGLMTILVIIAWQTDFRQDDAALLQAFAGQTQRPAVRRYAVVVPGEAARTIRYIEMPDRPDAPRPVILFVHGAPSSLSFFADFFKDTTLTNHARLVAVDRPGYGYSDFGRVETSITRQAQYLQPLIDRYQNAPFLLVVGSSYGGSVSARLAMNNPGVVSHVLFVSSSLGPGLERTYPISYVFGLPALRWLVPPLLRLANDEKLAHRHALEEILPDWPRITSGITILHGQLDQLIYPTNVAFARQQLVHAVVQQFLLPDSQHDIVVNRREYMTAVISRILARRGAKPASQVHQLALNAGQASHKRASVSANSALGASQVAQP